VVSLVNIPESQRAPLDRDLAVDADPISRAFDCGRLESKQQVALGVEELGRLEMGCKIRVSDLNRRDLCRSPQHAVGDDHVEVAEATGERAGHVADGKTNG